MAKLTQFGRMRRRIKRELEEARGVRNLAYAQAASMLASAQSMIDITRQAVITTKMLEAWKKERAGEALPEDAPGEFTQLPVNSAIPSANEEETKFPLAEAVCTNGEQHIYLVYSYGPDWIDMECTECRDVKKNLLVSR